MAQRQSVNFPGFSHSNPIPNASRIGNIMMTSVISGVDPGTRNLPSELDGQVAGLAVLGGQGRQLGGQRLGVVAQGQHGPPGRGQPLPGQAAGPGDAVDGLGQLGVAGR